MDTEKSQNTDAQMDSEVSKKSPMSQPKENTSVTPAASSSKSNNMGVIIAMVVTFITLIAIGVGAFILLKKDDVKKFEDSDDIEEFINEVADNINGFDGILVAKIEDSSGDNVQSFSIDLPNEIFYYKDKTSGSEIYADSKNAYTYTQGQWIKSTLAEAGLDEDSIFQVNIASSATDLEDGGVEECPENIKGDCYVIEDPKDNSISYVSTKTDLIVYQAINDISFVTYTYEKGESIEIPEDVLDEAVSYSSYSNPSTSTSDEEDEDDDDEEDPTDEDDSSSLYSPEYIEKLLDTYDLDISDFGYRLSDLEDLSTSELIELINEIIVEID